MKTRKIGQFNVSMIGLGGLAIAKYNVLPDKEAIELIQFAVKNGVTLIDTADIYDNNYRNEKLIGKALTPEQKENIVISTKVGGTHNWEIKDGSPKHIYESVRGSLERLGLKKIKLYQLHAPDPNVPIQESMLAFKELQKEGLIGSIGVCNFTLEQVIEARKVVDIASVQNRYNLELKQDERELLPYLTKAGIAYIAFYAVGSGKPNKPKIRDNPRLGEIAKELGITPSQAAIAWVINKWPITIPIVGTSSKEHLLENIKSAYVKLPKYIIKELDSLYPASEYVKKNQSSF